MGYQTINVIAGNNQANAAMLAASPVGNDAIFAQGDSLTISYPLGTLNLENFVKGDSVIATSGGGTDTISSEAIDFALSTQGTWSRSL